MHYRCFWLSIPITPHEDDHNGLRKALTFRERKVVSAKTLRDLCGLFIKNNIFKFNENSYKQDAAIGRKMALPHAILF